MSDFRYDLLGGEALHWTFSGAAIIITCGRFYIRWHFHKRFQGDDVFNGLALLLLLAYLSMADVITWDPTTADRVDLQNKTHLAFNLLLWTTLYAVKASFLVLLQNIFGISIKFCRFWLAVTVYTFLTFLAIFLSEFWQCGSPANYAADHSCMLDLETGEVLVASYIFVPIWIRAFLHISSDLFILLLPLGPIRKLHMPLVKKIGVATTFAFILINIGMGLVKNVTAVALYSNLALSDGWLVVNNVFSYVEPALAVIVCALPAYRVLLPSPRARRGSDQEELAPNARGKRTSSRTLPKGRDESLLQMTQVTRSSVEETKAAHMI